MKRWRPAPDERVVLNADDSFPVEPECFEHPDRDWMRGTVDGLLLPFGAVLFIDCSGADEYAQAAAAEVPRKARIQMQHLLAVAGLHRAYYLCYRRGEALTLSVWADPRFIADLMLKEVRFWEGVVRCVPLG